jgi:threonine/homoserine/homoserine lactone efflux protein
VTLEDKYRRLSRLFPAEWRDSNEEELIGTLLDAAEPGRDSIPPSEAVDLVRCALVLRFRALLTKPVVAGIREYTRVAGPISLALLSAFAIGLVIRFWVSDVSAEFLLTSLVVALVPGTGVVYTVSSSISGGWRRGLFAAIGCTFGVVPHVLAAMLGLSGVMQAGAVAFEAVRWAGVAYLLFMGVSMIRNGGALQLESHDASIEPMRRVVKRGILLNLLNPKLTVFFFAFLPQFLDTPPNLLDTRLIGLGGLFMLVTLAVFVVYAWVSAAVRDRVLGTPLVLRWIRRSLGGLLVGFAARLAVADRR